MALTAQQKVDTRRYMGYSAADPGGAYFGYRETAYSNVSYMGISLDGSTAEPNGGRLNNLSAEEESTLVNYFLANLSLREQEIQGAAANLDTDVAAVWTRNRSEVSDRVAIFTALRLELCGWLGFPPGAALAGRGRVTRC